MQTMYKWKDSCSVFLKNTKEKALMTVTSCLGIVMLEEMLFCIASLPLGCWKNKHCVLASLPDTNLEPHLSSSFIVNGSLAYRWLSEEVLVIWVDVWNLAVCLPSSFRSVMLRAWAFLCWIQQLCTTVWIFTFISADFHEDLACQDYCIRHSPWKSFLWLCLLRTDRENPMSGLQT